MARRLTTAEAAVIADCHRETIRRAIRRKELLASYEPTKRGRGFSILPADLASFMEKRRTSR